MLLNNVLRVTNLCECKAKSADILTICVLKTLGAPQHNLETPEIRY